MTEAEDDLVKCFGVLILGGDACAFVKASDNSSKDGVIGSGHEDI